MIKHQPVTTAERVIVVSIMDEAVDHEKSDLKAYAKTLDERFLSIAPGKVPTKFVLRPCSQSEVRRAFANAAADVAGRDINNLDIAPHLLRYGLVGAQNFTTAGDLKDWPYGIPLDEMEKIPAVVQIQIGSILDRITNGDRPDLDTWEPLADEGKSPSPSSSKGQGNSKRSASTAKPARSLARKKPVAASSDPA